MADIQKSDRTLRRRYGAVILELAEPSVRAGIWNILHSQKSLGRLQRTGLAAMITCMARAASPSR